MNYGPSYGYYGTYPYRPYPYYTVAGYYRPYPYYPYTAIQPRLAYPGVPSAAAPSAAVTGRVKKKASDSKKKTGKAAKTNQDRSIVGRLVSQMSSASKSRASELPSPPKTSRYHEPPPYTDSYGLQYYGYPKYYMPPRVRFNRPTDELFWLTGKYLSAAFDRGNLTQPLLTIGSLADVPPGALGQPGTQIIVGEPLNLNMLSGAEAEVGFFVDCENRYSLALRGFWYFPKSETFTLSSIANGNPLIGRPVVSSVTGSPIVTLVSAPNLLDGSSTITQSAELFGFELYGSIHKYYWKNLHLELLVGARFARLEESLAVDDRINPLVANVVPFLGTFLPAGDVITRHDEFNTKNDFYGVEIGTRVYADYNWLRLSAYGKVALGATQQTVDIQGSTTQVSTGQTATGGVLAQTTNIGRHSRTVFSAMPELGLDLEVALTKHLHVTCGYSLLMWTNVARPGNQIDPVINQTLPPSSPAFGVPAANAQNRPVFLNRDELFLVHTFNVGVTVRY